jgi:hypothetical protein
LTPLTANGIRLTLRQSGLNGAGTREEAREDAHEETKRIEATPAFEQSRRE